MPSLLVPKSDTVKLSVTQYVASGLMGGTKDANDAEVIGGVVERRGMQVVIIRSENHQVVLCETLPVTFDKRGP